MVISIPSESAMSRARLNASFQPSLIYGLLGRTIAGVDLKAASKQCMPLMPILSIHKRSFLIPSGVTIPFIQCHHTLG